MFWLTLLALLCASALWPLAETLCWWRLWHRHAQSANPEPAHWRTAVIFLTGINDYAAGTLEPDQRRFLSTLRQALPSDLFLKQAFPYERHTARAFAPWDLARKLGLDKPPLWLFSTRNFWQAVLATCCEHAYGRSIAACLAQHLGRPSQNAERRLLLICGSTGAAMALAASPFLKQAYGGRICIIALGGVWGNTRGWQAVDEFHQVLGTHDIWARLTALVWPGHWLAFRYFRPARDAQRFQTHPSGPHEHYGTRGYLSQQPCTPEQTYGELTIEALRALPCWPSFAQPDNHS